MAAPTTATAAQTTTSTTSSTTAAPATTAPRGPVRLTVTELATGLDTVWAVAFDRSGRLWFTERPGRLTRLGDEPRTIEGVVESGEAGLMGLEFDRQDRVFLMYTSPSDNRIVRLEADGSQRVLVSGLARASIHDGGRLRFGPDGRLYAGTGDAANPSVAQRDDNLSGKILQIDPDSGQAMAFSKGHRNAQGLCFAPDGRLLATEHGPTGNDEVNVITPGFNGGWPNTSGNGIRNWSPSIAPTGCVVYSADAIPQWKGSMLFATLRGQALYRLSFGPDGGVSGEEVLYEGEYGRLRDVTVGPDGAVYVATSNRDGRGSPRAGDDKILRIGPA